MSNNVLMESGKGLPNSSFKAVALRLGASGLSEMGKTLGIGLKNRNMNLKGPRVSTHDAKSKTLSRYPINILHGL
jgi:hypothetical protein